MSFETKLIWKQPSEWSIEEWLEFEKEMPQRLRDAIVDDIYLEVEDEFKLSGYWEDEYGFDCITISNDGYGFYGFYKLGYLNDIEDFDIDGVNEDGDEVTYYFSIDAPKFDDITNFNITRREFDDAFYVECYEDDMLVDISDIPSSVANEAEDMINAKIDAIWSIYQNMVVEAKRYGSLYEDLLLLMGKEFREWFTNNYYDFHAAFDENGNFINYKW